MKSLARKTAQTLAAFALVSLVITGCTPTASEPKDSQETPSVNFAVDPLAAMSVVVADDQGLFDDEGVEVSMQRFLAIQGVDAVLGGQMDFGEAVDFAVLSRLKTGRIKIIAALAQPEPGFNKLVVANDISSPADLKGKTLGTVGGTVQEYITQRFLAENGVSAEDVEVQRFTDFSEVVAALRTGRIDAGWVRATDMSEATKDGNVKLLNDDSSVRATATIFLVAGTDFIKENPETVGKVLVALSQGSGFLNDDPEAAADVVAKWADGDAGVFAQLIPSQHFDVSLTAEQIDGLKDIQKFGEEVGLLEPGDVDSYIDAGPLTAVLPKKVSL
jgi:NitT/TauT family transport system substrate-binding protein